jgi:hypothetical protein
MTCRVIRGCTGSAPGGQVVGSGELAAGQLRYFAHGDRLLSCGDLLARRCVSTDRAADVSAAQCIGLGVGSEQRAALVILFVILPTMYRDVFGCFFRDVSG